MYIEKLNRLIELSKIIEPLPEGKLFTDGKWYKLHSEFIPLCIELVPELLESCQNAAEWEISREDDLYHFSYSCTDHLSDMVEIETTNIKKVVEDAWGKCHMICISYNERFYKDAPQG